MKMIVLGCGLVGGPMAIDLEKEEAFEITIVDIRGEKVRLGINAPAHVPVHRKEVYEAIKREKQASGGDAHVDSLANRKHPPAEPKPEQDKPKQ